MTGIMSTRKMIHLKRKKDGSATGWCVKGDSVSRQLSVSLKIMNSCCFNPAHGTQRACIIVLRLVIGATGPAWYTVSSYTISEPSVIHQEMAEFLDKSFPFIIMAKNRACRVYTQCVSLTTQIVGCFNLRKLSSQSYNLSAAESIYPSRSLSEGLVD